MKLKYTRAFLLITAIAVLSIVDTGCQSKSKDADIKAAIEVRFKDDPMAAKVSVDVKDAVVTLSGQTMSDSSKTYCTRVAETITYVKSVINNCTIAENPDDALNRKIYRIAVDYPYIKIGAMNGIVQVAGSLKKDEWQKLKTDVDKLNPKGYDTAMLRIE